MRAVLPTERVAGPVSPFAPAAALSNGRYEAIVTAWGTGGSFFDGLALTRWRADPVSDRDGVLVYLQDAPGGRIRSAGLRPAGEGASRYEARRIPGAFVLERADADLEARLEICVSPHDPVEIRRLVLRNRGRSARRVGVTSYLEVVLEERRADLAHPSFSKLFVETSFDAEREILLARRRPRARGERHPCLAHALVGEGALEFETDRARFLGRGSSAARPRALLGSESLSGAAGAVLDPILCFRRWCRLEPGATRTLILLVAADWEEDAAVAALLRHAGHDQVEDALALAAMRERADWERAGGSEEWMWRAEPSQLRPAASAERAGETQESPSRNASPGDNGNGIGRFVADGTEYAIRLRRSSDGTLALPPMPWINVLANEEFGCLVSEVGAGYTWSRNSREHRLTPWANDPVLDPHGEAHYLRDAETGRFWSLLPGPAPAADSYEVRHGLGYTTFRHVSEDIEHEVRLFVPGCDPIQVALVRLTNRSAKTRRLHCVTYRQLDPEWARDLGEVHGSWDDEAGALLLRLPARGDLPESFAVSALSLPGLRTAADFRKRPTCHSFTCDRAGFLGAGGEVASPAVLRAGQPLSDAEGSEGSAAHPCAAQAASFELRAGETVECVLLFGEAPHAAAARALVEKYRAPTLAEEAWRELQRYWRHTLAAIRIETPSAALDRAVNGWLPYQTLACRLWARSALYQSGGAFGFRDQIQDAMALVHHVPEQTRAQLLLHAAHQFEEGDVLHWWHPPLGRGLRTRFADDLLWLPLLAAQYVRATGDEDVLREEVRFLSAPSLAADEDEAFLLGSDSGRRADLYEHCGRALDRSLATGRHGLPLFGTGDWNDGMNRVGREGRGESVWMGFFLHHVLGEFLPLCERREDRARARRYEEHRENLRQAVERHGWDGAWYLRGYYDDGTPLGSRSSDECRIDGLVQAWSVLSGAAAPERARQALEAAREHLVSEEEGIIRLLWPPFDRSSQDPGYVKGYLPGVRENGGQYTHGALWMVRAFAELGRSDRAARLLEMLLPENHARSAADVLRYQVEPYAIAADVYGAPPHVGRGGWTWYTGSAGWALRVAVESILGLRLLDGRAIEIRPCVPDEWPAYRISYRLPGEITRYEFSVRREGSGCATRLARVDGVLLAVEAGRARIPLAHDGETHTVEIVLGA